MELKSFGQTKRERQLNMKNRRLFELPNAYIQDGILKKYRDLGNMNPENIYFCNKYRKNGVLIFNEIESLKKLSNVVI
jgi:hypothetical protein